MTRICLKTSDIRALQRDGIGWGYDFDCGCLHVESGPRAGGRRLSERLGALVLVTGRAV